MKAKRLLAALTALMVCLSVTVQPALADFEESVVTEDNPIVQPAEEESNVEMEPAEEMPGEITESVEEESRVTTEEPAVPETEKTPAEPLPEVTETEEPVLPEEEPVETVSDSSAEEDMTAVPVEETSETVAAAEDAAISATLPAEEALSEADTTAEDVQPAVQDVGGVELTESNFPDTAFLAVVKEFDKDANGTLSTEEIAAVSGIYASGKGISDLTGIANFTELKVLEVSDNRLTNLDLSSNTKLELVVVSDNRLTSLNLSGLTNLAILWADSNNLTSLDLRDNPLDGGQAFSVTENALTQITLPGNGKFDWENSIGNQRLPGGKGTGYQLKWYTDSSYGTPLQMADGTVACSGQTLYSRAEAIQYTLSFSAGSEPVTGQTSQMQVDYDQTVQLPACGFTPSDNEREFAGWKLGGAVYKENQEVKNLTDRDGANLELVAQWRYKDYSGQQYSITLHDGQGGRETFQANYGADAAITTNLKKEHYHLVGWALQEGGAVWLKADKTISYARPSLLEAALGQQPELYAVWEIDRHTVSFAGTGISLKPITADYGSTITLPAAPHRTGYVFEGWYGEDGKAWDQQSDVVEKDTTLTARYRAARFTVRFDGNGADSGTMNEMQVTYDQPQALTACGFKRDWYDFEGWSFTPEGQPVITDGSDASHLSITDGDTVTLYAVWKRQQADVTVTINGEQHVYKADLGKTLEIPEPQRAGWRFTGWVDELGSPWQADTVVTGVLNLTASFEPIEYTVVFDGNGADRGAMREMQVTYDQGQTLAPCGFKRDWYDFEGWSLTPEGRPAVMDGADASRLTIVDGDTVTLYAVWKRQQADVTVTINGEQHVYKADLGAALKLPEPQRTGWRFAGWVDEHGSPWKTDAAVKGKLNLTASFEPIVYTVVFDGNGADNAKAMENASFSLTYDRKTVLPANLYTRTGYAFLGWSRTPGGQVEYRDGATVEALTVSEGEVVTLYAVWQAPQPSNPETGNDDSSVEEGTNVSSPVSQEQAVSGEKSEAGNTPVVTGMIQEAAVPAVVSQHVGNGPVQTGDKEATDTEHAAEQNLPEPQQEPEEAPQKAEETAPQQIGDAQQAETSRPDWVRALALAVGAVVLVGGGGFAAAYALRFKKR